MLFCIFKASIACQKTQNNLEISVFAQNFLPLLNSFMILIRSVQLIMRLKFTVRECYQKLSVEYKSSILDKRLFDYLNYLFRFLMVTLHQFLQPISQPQKFEHNSPSYLFTTDSGTVQAQINEQLQITISESSDTQVYALKPTCLLFPTYSGSTIKKIGIWEKNLTMNISGDHQLINKLYSRLCRVMTHKGFNDFYKPLKRLGRGGFASVYLVEHKYTGIRRAAKVFSKVGQNIEYMGKEALQNQIKTLKQINHPNLIKYDGLYQTDSLIYLVTQYLSGGTLESTLKATTSHTGQLIKKIIRDLLQGLVYLDERQIMHRDLKPENIILREEDNKWVIGDFGLAAHSNEQYIYDQCGTMGYIAPEIIALAENKKYSQSCDSYSLGVIAYQLIVGELPFKVQSENFLEKKIVDSLFESEESKTIHPSIVDFLLGLLQKDPKLRLTPKRALQSAFFTEDRVAKELCDFHKKRRQARYDRILKMTNLN